MLARSSIQLLIATSINNAGNGTYLTPTFAGLAEVYNSGYYNSIHAFITAGYYSSNQVWNGSSSVVMRGDPIMGKNEYGRNDISSGAGNDVIYSATGNYLAGSGNAGHDLIIAHDKLDGHGGEGNDFIAAGVDINSNASGNFLTAWKAKFANVQAMSEGDLNQCFTYRNNNSTIYGDEDNDFIVAPGNGNNIIYGDNKERTSRDGNDTIIVGNGNNDIYGGGGHDNIYVGTGTNKVYGGDGDDILYTDNVVAKYEGGAGFDVCSFALKNSAILVDNTFWSKADSVEGVIGTVHADTISGSSASDQIDGNTGDDTLNGGGGDDILFGRDGSDKLSGDAGLDRLLGGTGDDAYKFRVGSEVDYVYENPGEGAADYASLQNVSTFGLFKSGNDLWIAVSNNDVMVLYDWYLNNAVEYVYLEATNQYGVLTELAQHAQVLTSQAATSSEMLRTGEQNMPDYLSHTIQLTPETIDAVALAGVNIPAPLVLA